MIKALIARGIGFGIGTTSFIVTAGLSIGSAVITPIVVIPIYGRSNTTIQTYGLASTTIILRGSSVSITKAITFHRGEDLKISFTIDVSDTVRYPTGLTEKTLKFSIWTSDGVTELTTCTTGDGSVTVVDAALGTGTIIVSSTKTNIAEGKYYYTFGETNSGALAIVSEGVVKITNPTAR